MSKRISMVVRGQEIMLRYSALVVAVLCANAACGVISTAPAQAPSTAGHWEVPRTPDGHPDLQGNWTNVTLTPFERPEGQGPVLTQEEVDSIEGRRESAFQAGIAPSDPGRTARPAGGSVGTYNEIYWDRGSRVAIIDGKPISSLITDPPNGRRPPFTPEAERLRQERTEFRSQFGEADHPENLSLTVRCLMFGSNVGPPMVPNGAYNNNYTIVQTADYVVIHAEVVHDTRIIRIGDGPRLPDHVRPWIGDSWGRWEGDALVVETTNIYPLHTFRGIRPTKDLKVFERFTRVDQETILYEFTVDDPTTYTEPWGGQIPMRALHAELYEYACHEGNYSLGGILSGARYQERRAAQNRDEPR